MKINWKVRFKNKVWLASFISLVLGFIYNLLGMLHISPAITEAEAGQIASQVLMILGLLGVVIDPTTEGVGDSNRAMSYVTPWNDALYDGEQDQEKKENDKDPNG